MAGRYNTWLRAKLADRIERNGGYHAGRGASFALSWTVRYYGAIANADDARRLLLEHEHFINEADLELRFPYFNEWFHTHFHDTNTLYEEAQSRLQEDLSNDEGLRMWNPDTAKRYGFDYKGDGAERPFYMTLAGYGSGGKHICLTMFDGVNLDQYCRDLVEAVAEHRTPDASYSHRSNQWCRMLMGIMDELDAALTDDNAASSGAYYETYFIAQKLGLFD